MPCIDWTLIGPAMVHLSSLLRRCWVTKHILENCGIDTPLFKWNMQVDKECALCGRNEDIEHILGTAGP
jgi:hypothetical protein